MGEDRLVGRGVKPARSGGGPESSRHPPFGVTINQSKGSLSGSWSMQAQVSGGVSVANVQGTGSLTGTIGSGSNPSVNITIRGSCPNYEAQFSGTYDSANRRLTLIGPIDILNQDCTVALRYPSTVVLNR